MPEATSAATTETEAVQESSVVPPQIREQDQENLLDYLKGINAGSPIKVAVIRELPKLWGGRSIEGTLDTFEEPISEEEIRELFGGGKYKLMISMPDHKGSWRYATSRRLKIAGDPKLDSLISTPTSTAQTGNDSDLAKEAMKMSMQMATQERRRADEERERAATAASAATSNVTPTSNSS